MVCLIISYLALAPHREKAAKMTWTTGIFKEETKELAGLPWFKNYRILARDRWLVLVIIII
ncbi:MAG: hypothetical protein DHS20C17_27290 [Cyclobacteriaceae bacterium]|nr:MAG: hypothetical protein DHS20C17_27290 [Cyclobacteriaceae bacterium]